MLIVDDNQFNIEILTDLVREHGNASDSAISGRDAINLITSRLNNLYFEK